MEHMPSIIPPPRTRERECGVRQPRGMAAITVCVLFFLLWFPAWACCVAVAAQFDRTRGWARWLRDAGVRYCYGGFTLIELSIALVIIGLVVGGVLVGQNLIKAAETRAEITQLEKFNTATNTFYAKYGYLPGDIPAPQAAQFGFAARGTNPGEGDGNGVIQGVWTDCSTCNDGNYEQAGETIMFWADLSAAHMIEGAFTRASSTQPPTVSPTQTSNPSLSAYLPEAKISGNYVSVWSNSIYGSAGAGGMNYFTISGVSSLYGSAFGMPVASPNLTVGQAYAIDKKIDDGLPQSGRVIAYYNTDQTLSACWAGGTCSYNFLPPAAYTTATTGSSASCFDNNSTAGAQQTYSLTQSNGAGVNCALSLRMQAGD